MIGTLVNVTTITVGSFVGSRLKKGIGEKYQKIMMDSMGLASICLGVNSVVHAMPDSKYKVLFIVSLALGGVIGTKIDLDNKFQKFIKKLTGGKGDSNLAQGLQTAILLFCVGTMCILGPIQSALYGDNTYLFTNATLDLISSMVLASNFGFGIALAAPVLFCWQGSLYMFARFIAPYLTDALMTEISILGGALILTSGLNILKIKEIKTVDLLPSLLIPPVAVTVLNMLGI